MTNTKTQITIATLMTALFMSLLLSAPSQAAGIFGPYMPYGLKRAEKMLDKGEAEAALDLLQQSIRHYSRSNTRARNLGLQCLALLHLDRPADAAQVCLESLALDLGHSNWAAAHNLGVAHYRLGRTHQAQEAFEKAIVMNPQSRASRRNLRRVSNATALASTNH